MKTKISKIGRRGKMVLAVLIAVMFVSVASAALLTNYGKVTTTVRANQSIWVDGKQYPNSGNIKDEISDLYPGGKTFCFPHLLDNRGPVPIDIELNPDCSGTDFDDNWINCEGITTTYYKLTEYSFTHSQDVNDGTVGQLVTTVAEDGDWMVWTFDFPVELFTGDGNLNVGLIIATDGEAQGPAFQIHNNDGADSSYDWGTWLMSPWGPTIDDGWFGWHSGDTNTPVTELAWVEATGNRNVPHNDGVMEIRILKSELGKSFHWAASPTVGSGFYAPAYDVTMQIPTGFDWGIPIVDMTVPNYIEAIIMTEIPKDTPFTMQPGQKLLFFICHSIVEKIYPGTYIITTTIK